MKITSFFFLNFNSNSLHDLEPNPPPFRPIVTSYGTYNYELAKVLYRLFQPHIPSDYSITDFFTFVDEIKNYNVIIIYNKKCMKITLPLLFM